MSLLAAEIGRQVSQLARRADTSDIDGWWSRIFRQLVELIAAAWRTVRRLTGDYLIQHGLIEGHTVEPVPAQWNTEQVATSLRVTGPVAFKNAISKGRSEEDARRSMVSALAGATQRIVLNGGRDTIAATVEASTEDNGEIVGWRRVSDGDPCPWCAMLIGRGAVYGSQASASRVVGRAGRAKAPGQRAIGTSYHDHCGCTAEPLYDFEEEPAEVEEIYEQWRTVTAGKSFKAALKAWREYWNSDARRDRTAAQDIADELEPDVADPAEPEPVEPEPAEEVPFDPHEAARDRQRRIDALRDRAEFLALLEELVYKDADERVMRHTLKTGIRRGFDTDPIMSPLLDVDVDDRAAIRALVRKIAATLGLSRTGGDRLATVRNPRGVFEVELGRFRRGGLFKPIGDPLREGEEFEIVSPGYTAEVDGQRITLKQAIVIDRASDDEVLSEIPLDENGRPGFHESLRSIQDLADLAAAAGDAERSKLSGGQSADVQLVRLDDGRAAVYKRGLDWGDPEEVAASVRSQADAEQLAALVAETIGARVARVYRNEVDAVWMEYIPNASHDFGAQLDSRDGILLGLLDALIVNGDRNGGNLLLSEAAELVGIDHGFAWAEHLREDGLDRPQLNADSERPVKHFVTSDRQWSDNPLTPEDVSELRARLTRLRPDFARLGRGDWLTYTLNALNKLAEFAKGTVRLYE